MKLPYIQESTHPRYAWEVIVPASVFGKRIRDRFNDQGLAHARLATYLSRLGPATPTTRDESLLIARWRYRLTNAEIEAALTVALARKTRNAVTLAARCAVYMAGIDAAHKAGRVGDLHARDVEHLTPKLAAGPLGRLPVQDLSRREIQSWLDEMPDAPITKRNRLRNLTHVLQLSVRDGVIPAAPSSGITVGKCAAEVGIVTPRALVTLLDVAAARGARDTYWWLVFGAFAGMRTSEIERLDWSDVQPTEDFDDEVGAVYVRPGKTAAAERWVHFTEPLEGRGWSSKPLSGPVLVLTANERLRQRQGVYTAAGESVPNNGLRHSYASHHLVAFKEPHQTAAEMGHNTPRMTFSAYRKAVPDVQAQDYWKIALRPDDGK